VTAVGRLSRAAEIRRCRHQKLRRSRRRHDRRRVVPARVRGQLPVGASGYRGDRVPRRGGRESCEGPHGDRCPPIHRVSAQTRRRLIRAGCVCLALLPGVLRAQADTTARRTTTAGDTTARDTTAALLPVFGPAIASGPLPKHTRYTFTSDSLLLSSARTL